MTNGEDLSRRAVLGTVGTAALRAGLGTTSATAGRGRGGGCPGADHLPAPAPGPDVLYDDPVSSPTLAPSDGWAADPLLVSGGEAYVDGEYLYQGWVHDDYGAATPEETGTSSPVETTLDAPEGDLVYPTDEARYRYNAADVVEVRARPTRDGVAYRIALNTMVESHEDAAVVAIGIDTGSGETRTDWGHGLGDLGTPVDTVVVVAGDEAAVDGEASVAAVDADADRNHLEVEVSLEPGEATWTHYAVAGIHDGDLGFAPVQPQPTETEPGGAAVSDVPPVFDVAFRTHEDEPLRDPDTGLGISWREYAQSQALADRDISALGADIDFGALEAGETEANVSRQGFVNRLFASRADFTADVPYDSSEGVDPSSRPLLLGDVQPYSVYVPTDYDHVDPEPRPVVVMPHSLGQNYNQYAQTVNLMRQLGEQRGAFVVMFEGRGPDGWWRDEAEFDLFEALGDARSRYAFDLDHVTVNGYSMGGYGTYKLASQYPDLLGAGFAVVGPADEDIFGGPTNGEFSSDEASQNTMRITDNLRHVPLLMWAGTNDELVPYPGVRNYRRQLADHGYRHRLDTFPGFDHFAFFFQDEWGPGAAFLGDAGAPEAPERVTYRKVPKFDNERFGLVHDGAYWVQAIEVADDADDGLVDATSLADGYGEPVAESFQTAAAEPAPNTREGVRWAAPLAERAAENAIELDLSDVSAATLYVDETGVDVTAPLTIRADSTHAAEVTLKSGAGEAVLEVPAGTSETTVTLCERGAGAPATDPDSTGPAPRPFGD
jgi:pimeloyl-ACP methyl ester carboxylesterase